MSAENYLYWIPLLPLMGAAVNGFFGRRIPKSLGGPLACLGPLAAFALAVAAFFEARGIPAGAKPIICSLGSWIEVGTLNVSLAFAMDRLAAVMALVVTGVGSVIHIYSIGYMRKDPGYSRYFSYLNLFMTAMLVLVLADNLVFLFLGWEGVGLCSYLLIGFWYEDEEKASAGKKAFIVNRIGDFGFLLGIFLTFVALGTLDLHQINSSVDQLSGAVRFWIPLLLFVGAVGKSAQIPLYVWLPDAMAGPTPVSALIHAATMVTSGVYLLARLGPVYSHSPEVLAIVATIGAVTALLAAFIALTQFDIKKVLAYSTVSQLGYMFFAAGLASYSVAIFHLAMHSFFKGLLFLGAGAVIHSLHHEQDMRHMGGLRKPLPVTFWTMVAGALAIAGCPLLSGFFSKDAILIAAMEKAFGEHVSVFYLILWILGTLTAVMTCFYIFRLIAMTFFGESRFQLRGAGASHQPAEGAGEIHESPPVMLVPLVILAALSVVGGILFNVPHFLAPASEAAEGAAGHPSMELAGEVIGVGAFVLGLLVVGYFYWLAPQKRVALVEKNPAVRFFWTLSINKVYMDEIYDALIVKPLHFLAEMFYIVIDRLLIDGLMVSGSGLFARGTGTLLRQIQTGRVPTYAAWFVGGVVLLLLRILIF